MPNYSMKGTSSDSRVDTVVGGEVEPVLIFLHIPKTGGTTLNYILEQHYSREESFATFPSRLHPNGSIEGFKSLPDAEKTRIKVLYGHMGFGLHDYFARPAVYVTVLRDPIERVLSQFYHDQREPLSPFYSYIQSGEMDLEGYARHYALVAEMDNLQTRMLAGNWNLRGYGECTVDMLATAKRHLRMQFAVVGITERFDEFYLMLCRRLGWPAALYKKHQVTRKRPRQDELDRKTLELIRDYNRFDIQLYQYASELFEAQVRQQGSYFAAELRSFRLRITLYHHYWELRRYSVRAYLRQWLGASPNGPAG
jgi:hypothetical protein